MCGCEVILRTVAELEEKNTETGTKFETSQAWSRWPCPHRLTQSAGMERMSLLLALPSSSMWINLIDWLIDSPIIPFSPRVIFWSSPTTQGGNGSTDTPSLSSALLLFRMLLITQLGCVHSHFLQRHHTLQRIQQLCGRRSQAEPANWSPFFRP